MADEELAKDLGPLAALTIGVGTMIGAGIFVLPGTAIQQAGWFAVVSFLVGGAIALLTALSASELGTAMPRSGGAYFYVNRALGPLFGSVAGWANWMGLAFASAFYMVGFGQYVQNIAGLSDTIGVAGFGIDPVKLIALAGAALFVLINYVGAKETGKLQNIIVVILVAILAVFTVVGSLRADPANLPESRGFGPMITTTGLIFVSYLGFVQITSVAEEIKDPDRNLPRAVIGSVVIVTLIYALVLIVMSAAVEQGFIAEQEAAGNIAVVEVAELILGPAGAIAMLIGGLLATASSANASILASSRINFAMGRDAIVTPDLNEIHERFGTPYRSIAVTGGFILVFIVVAPIDTLATMGSVLHLVIYGLLNIALIVMREADVEEYDPSYTVPFYPVTPIVGSILSFALIAFIEPRVTIAFSAAFVAFAVLWYLFYARSRTTKQGVLSDYILSRADRMPEPAVSAATTVKPDGGQYRVMVPLANPENQTDLITLASAIAKQESGTVVAVNIQQVPDQTSLEAARRQGDYDAAHRLLERARDDAETFDVPVETHTILSHRTFEEVFDAARTYDADLTVMGWGPDAHGSPGRAESAIDELASSLPCDFLVLRDRGFDASRILVPTAGGPDSDLSAAIAKLLRAEYGSTVTLLHVADDESEGREFLEGWADNHGLGDAELVVESGDVEAAIESHARDATMLVVGATERGLLSRLFTDSLVLNVVEDVDCSVLLAEKKRKRTLRERLFGSN
ncbi:amino acid transporter [Haloprofundus marisrubri]|uniref:Amino acid transporter n=1 Tax=Haloprofundus marisrubri TaxID=1514971 RepID=A0A0W1R7B7_9EURY|nr:amino acid permease [Haloprofundus marisrubri]KTG09478.1 amino acid transporter [Haloprofundus marisrubri]